MKKLFLIATFVISSVTFAQSTAKEDIEIIQGKYGKSKKELVSTYMELKESQAAAFWKTYDAYEEERKQLGKKRIDLINDYINNYEKLSNEKADQLLKATLKNDMAYGKLYSKYYDKMKKAIGAIDAAKFIQLEHGLQTAIMSETQNAIPFIGDMDRSK
ncbi:hypothetical protein FEDK69T_00080 [Flavobacterium enshiense DK69]|uniref:OmpH family outer membrane protein n=1 Tax=Flavobacterium enshiense DK69 TaxID=1107311 RepID=V6SEY6_9FLAO|nr:hypothetical protein [Flavobacterium enshiense]ESU25243.1 hypothetical protein FEDK69T_00080 [Flavobacterium enshiense DK69]KGO93149.1 hypothetical protein Q767_14915 [Flavobacterium enshiense DK69]